MSSSRRGFLEQLLGASAVAVATPRMLAASAPAAAIPRSADDEAAWEALKREFAYPAEVVPVNAANMAPGHRSVVEAIVRAVRDVDADVSYQNRAEFDTLREAVRGRLGTLLGAAADEIAVVRNATEANGIVVAGIALEPGDEVVVSDQNHPSNNVGWDVRAARSGAVVRRITLGTPPASAEEIVGQFERATTARTRVWAFSDVSNTSGLRMPTEELCRRGRDRGIHVHVDGAQTLGALRRDVARLGCGSFAASGQKWLMGPREIGVLYVRADRLPAIWPHVVGVGWGAGAAPEAKGARKLEAVGQRNDASTAGLAAALDLLDRIGLATIEARVALLATRVMEGLRDLPGLGFATPRDPSLRHGVVVLLKDGAQRSEYGRLHERLYRDHGVIASPTGGLRISPSIAVTAADVDRVVAATRAVWRA